MVSMEGGLWLTAMNRIVLDDHGYEVFSEPEDLLLLTAEEISNGINIHDFQEKLISAILSRKHKNTRTKDEN